MRQEANTHAISSLSLLTRPTPALCLPSERASTAARGPKENIATEDLVVNTVFNHIQVSLMAWVTCMDTVSRTKAKCKADRP